MFPNSSNPHNLIPSENTYICDKHFVSFHSNDRDISKWPETSHFELNLPREMRGVETVRLSEISFPVNYHTFSKKRENTRFRFYTDVSGNIDISGTQIEIQDGYYQSSDLAQEIENRMNVSIQTNGTYNDPSYNRFHVIYDDIGHKMMFGNDRDPFRIAFSEGSDLYPDTTRCGTNISQSIFSRYTDWGLGSLLGFEKDDYIAKSINTPVHFMYLGKYISSDTNATEWFPLNGSTGYIVTAPNAANFVGDNTVYMEIDRMNSMDELVPYSDTSISTGYSVRENTYAVVSHVGGRPDSCFAKIPLTNSPYSQVFDSKNGFQSNVTQYNPPIERVTKMKFKFRSHDGTLFDFRNAPMTFTLEFNCIRNEIRNNNSVRTPTVW